MSEPGALSRNPVRIATRGSQLALWQAGHVRELLLRREPGLEIELVPIKTTGDKLLDSPLAKIGGKGLFIKELEQALLDRRADLAVHSMKDVPVELPDALHIPVVLAREDACDALVAPRHGSLACLPRGAVVGTSSLRRRSLLLARRPDLDLRNLRGNVLTRLEKLDRGEFDAIVLAMAGLKRLGLAHRVTQRFEPSEILPAIGQGIIGIECRRDDAATLGLIAPLHDPLASDALAAERALNASLQGGCQVPIAGHAVIAGETLTLTGIVATVDGTELLRAERVRPRHEAADAGLAVGEALRAAGAVRILSALER